jgi:DNA-binding NarL/FixJ family response regulator
MMKDIRILVIDQDPYVRNWMTLLIARDWRTHIAGEVGTIDELDLYLKKNKPRIDILIVEADQIANDPNIKSFNEAISKLPHTPQILIWGLKPDRQVIKHLTSPNFVGYLLRNEICNSLSWAAAIAREGKWVITPGIQEEILRSGVQLSGNGHVLDGRNLVAELTDREAEVARLAFIFSLERRDLADELNISKDWSYGLVSTVYKKLGLEEILHGEVDPTFYLGNNELVLAHFKDIISEMQGSPKAHDIETLAFHIFTMPEIVTF